jgi:hypothetical protein
VEFTELKKTFLKTIVERGYLTTEIPAELKVGIPTDLVEKWIAKLNYATPLTSLMQNPRLINRFTVGADPEFTFINSLNVQTPAMEMGLQTGLAFGMDMNGRLVELRPTPSRFVLNVVASMLAELRWLAAIKPETLGHTWLSTPYDGQDGVGGHTHFARKSYAVEDQSALKSLYWILLKLNVFNIKANDSRINRTKYGKAEDFRFQKHGFEYRAYPSWLGSPWVAYLVITLSKLSLYDPGLMDKIWSFGKNDVRILERAITNFLAFYKNVDDDAWIAFHALKKWGLPKQGATIDFKSNWGISFPPLLNKPDYYPSMIEGTDNERQAIFHYLVNKTPIRPDPPVINWEPAYIHKDYNWLMNHVVTYHKQGIGEICHDLVFSKKLTVDINSTDVNEIVVSCDKYKCQEGITQLKLLDNEQRVRWTRSQPNQLVIFLPKDLRTNYAIPLVRKILTSGLFPIWNVKDVKEGCFEEWVRRNKTDDVKFIGKELSL